ncbi:MAG TPA: S41 family peptidase [Candidatus Acidoferrum sp.]|nr:S41 family peptidase [Candidatus Acidoferrum sp.]
MRCILFAAGTRRALPVVSNHSNLACPAAHPPVAFTALRTTGVASNMFLMNAKLCRTLILASSVLLLGLPLSADNASPTRPGYYRFPAIHGDTVIFTAEGDLWSVSTKGGPARRLTSSPGQEVNAAISPDGKTVAFSADYEGPVDVYTMPVDGGLPQRLTWDAGAVVAGWTPDGRVLFRTRRYSTLPDPKLVAIDAEGRREVFPLSQSSEGAFTPDGKSLFFTRLPWQGSSTKRYQGGTAENIWRYDSGSEAVPLTPDYAGTSHNPMFWNGRVYFLSDRDGTMNVFSMDPQGRDVKQHTHHRGFDVQSASLSNGKMVYQCGADLWLLDLNTNQGAIIPITLVSDFDQLRDHWVKKPLEFLTMAHVAPDGSAAVFTARGEVFSLPAAPSGRIVKVAGDSSIRFREARYSPDGKSIIALSTASGETEFWKYPANGIGKPEQLTKDAKVLRWDGVPSPDGHWFAHRNKDQQLWLLDLKTKADKLIAQSMNDDFTDLAWSPDSQWLGYVEPSNNTFSQIKVLNVNTGAIQVLTSDRYNSGNPAWSSDGKWLYFLSDRMLKTTVRAPWGSRQPDPYFDRSMKVYELALTPGLRSPFAPVDELHPDKPEKSEERKTGKDDEKKDAKSKKDADDKKSGDDKKSAEEKKAPPVVNIDFTDIAARLNEVPVPAGNYSALQAAEKRLCWLDRNEDVPPKHSLQCVEIGNKGDSPETILADVKAYEISDDRKKILLWKDSDFLIFDSDAKSSTLSDSKAYGKAKIDMARWTILTNPRAEFRGMFLDAWRLERDYFYDRNMHGVNWPEVRDRYLPLVDRVADREELNDLLAQMVGELSALHIFVVGGDARDPGDRVDIATFGATLRRDEKAGGDVVDHIYLHDPDLPDQAPPFARPDSLVHEGEVILSIDGADVLGVSDERVVLRGKAGRKVLLQVKSTTGQVREVLVTPISERDERNLRYAEWEFSRRRKVEADSQNHIGYIHLRAMGSEDIAEWARDFYPVYDRQGLIIDVRHNNGGNIDSWILAKLLRRAWFYWQPRIGNPFANMQYAFRGHIVVLCDQDTASDGEAFSEGIRRLDLGKIIGMRTWGGEVWLSFSNFLADQGIASAAEIGVYGPDGKWLIEGHGVDPDVVVDNLPHATFAGSDAQLDAAIKYLQDEIQKDPRPVPPAPPYPVKAFKYDQ